MASLIAHRRSPSPRPSLSAETDPRPLSTQRAPSPRPSTSSSTGRKKPQLDFEEALNNSETLYLRPASAVDHSDDVHEEKVDDDAPHPVEKLSFEEELRGSRRAKAAAGKNVDVTANVLLGRPTQPGTPTVVPPTPSTSQPDDAPSRMRERFNSIASSSRTVSSGTGSDNLLAKAQSGTHNGLPFTPIMSKKQSVGLDAELEAISPINAKSSPSKRRSIFRSPTTASSPDLATLVRKAREVREALPSPSKPTQETTPTSNKRTPQRQTVPASPSPTPLHQRRAAPPPPLDTQSSPRPAASGRDRAASQGGALRLASSRRSSSAQASSEDWARSSGASEVRNVASGIAGGRQRPVSGEYDEGFKSMSRRATGFLGRMFSQKERPIPPASRAPISHYASTDPSCPPVPPVPSIHAHPAHAASSEKSNDTPHKMRSQSQASTAISAPESKAQAEEDGKHLPTDSTDYVLEAVTDSNTSSSRATGGDAGARLRISSDLDKPLPPIADGSPQPRRQSANGGSLHTHQPAVAEVEPFGNSPDPNTTAWKDHLSGVFESIGTDEPSKGLGLPVSTFAMGANQKHQLEVSRETSLVAGAFMPEAPSSPTPLRRTSLPSKLPTLGAALPSQPRKFTTSLTASEPSTATTAKLETMTTSDFGPALDPLRLNAQTVRLVSSNTPRSFEDTSPVKRLDMTSDDMAQSTFKGTGRPWSTEPTTPQRAQPSDNEGLEIVASPGDPDEADEEKGRRMACEFLEDDETHVPKEKIAMFLGGTRPVNKVALRYYMQYFDWAGQRLDNAFRELCQKLYLKAETQEVSRILEGFSERYYECNSGTIYGSAAVVYVVTGSFLLLNTDLHIAEISSHMSRSQFVRLTMETITQSIQSDRASTPDLIRDDGSSLRGATGSTTSFAIPSGSPSTIRNVLTARSDSAIGHQEIGTATPPVTLQAIGSTSSVPNNIGGLEPKIRSVSVASSVGSFSHSRSWESEMEGVLKDIYAAVKSNQILLPIGNPTLNAHRHSMVSLGSASPHSTISRTRSVRTPSGASSDRVNVFKRGSMRGMQSLLGTSPYGMTSDGRFSPTPSVATSIGEGFNSVHFGASLGFASNLSHSVIREHDDEARSVDSVTSSSTVDEMDDDELALLGAPWAKEGMLSRKLYWEAPNRRAKQKDWNKYFVVIQKGNLHLFVFGSGGGTSGTVGAVGGGNWLSNATPVAEINLSHSMASALPKPGYNSARPYCFSISMPGGEMSFYQAGTEELVQEWVCTCNYWAARRSRPPLQGGVSNMEYGWNRAGDLADDSNETESVMSNRSAHSRLGNGGNTNRRGYGNLEKVHINDWKPSQPSLTPSSLDEEAQLDALIKFVQSQVEEMEAHKKLEEPMKKLYLPRSSNGAKAMDNWKTKSLFIHSEIVKYETYVDALRNAISLRVKQQGERKLEKALKRAGARDSDDDDGDVVHHAGDVFGSREIRAAEGEEPVTPSQRNFRGN